MSRLQDIPISVLDRQGSQAQTGNVLPILNEIRYALALLAAEGTPTTIDLSAIPFAPGDREELDQVLGQGEVSAVVNALGETRIRETNYRGVWRVTHHSPQGDILAAQIEVTRTPSLLSTPEQDIPDAMDALDEYLNSQLTRESA